MEQPRRDDRDEGQSPLNYHRHREAIGALSRSVHFYLFVKISSAWS
jgi:hypothetical protein